MQNTTSTNAITRRTLLGAGALSALSVLASCSPRPQAVEQDNGIVQSTPQDAEKFNIASQYLPIGSVVCLRGFSDHITFMVVSRRPLYTSEDGSIPDYAGVFYPFGIMDLSYDEKRTSSNEVVVFNTEDITKVIFIGLQGTIETEAALELEAGRGTDESVITLLAPLIDSYFNVNEIIASVEEEEESSAE